MALGDVGHALVHMLLRASDQRDRKWPTGVRREGVGCTGAGGQLRGGVAV